MFAHTYICLVLALLHVSHALSNSTHVVSARAQKFKIGGKTYDIERLDEKLQSKESVVFKVIGGYEGTPAVVKMIVDYWHGSANNIEKEVEFTDRVGLRLADRAAKMSDGRDAHALVMKDIRESDPPLKTLLEWYREYENMDLQVVLVKLRYLIKASAWYLAQDHNMIYQDWSYANIFVDKDITEVTLVDFTLAIPNHLKPEGVTKGKGIRELEDEETKMEELTDFESFLHKHIPNLFNMRTFRKELQAVGDTMRQPDETAMSDGADSRGRGIWLGTAPALNRPLYHS